MLTLNSHACVSAWMGHIAQTVSILYEMISFGKDSLRRNLRGSILGALRVLPGVDYNCAKPYCNKNKAMFQQEFSFLCRKITVPTSISSCGSGMLVMQKQAGRTFYLFSFFSFTLLTSYPFHSWLFVSGWIWALECVVCCMGLL